MEILEQDGTNKELAERYNVSERTIARWKRRARAEQAEEEPFEVLPPEEQPEEQGTPSPEEDFYNDVFGDEDEEFEEKDPIQDIYDILNEYELIDKDSPFHVLPPETQKRYLLEYIMFQHDENPWKWYEVFGDNELHLDDPNGLSMLNIWNEEFDNWVKDQIEIDKTFV